MELMFWPPHKVGYRTAKLAAKFERIKARPRGKKKPRQPWSGTHARFGRRSSEHRRHRLLRCRLLDSCRDALSPPSKNQLASQGSGNDLAGFLIRTARDTPDRRIGTQISAFGGCGCARFRYPSERMTKAWLKGAPNPVIRHVCCIYSRQQKELLR